MRLQNIEEKLKRSEEMKIDGIRKKTENLRIHSEVVSTRHREYETKEHRNLNIENL